MLPLELSEIYCMYANSRWPSRGAAAPGDYPGSMTMADGTAVRTAVESAHSLEAVYVSNARSPNTANVV